MTRHNRVSHITATCDCDYFVRETKQDIRFEESMMERRQMVPLGLNQGSVSWSRFIVGSFKSPVRVLLRSRADVLGCEVEERVGFLIDQLFFHLVPRLSICDMKKATSC